MGRGLEPAWLRRGLDGFEIAALAVVAVLAALLVWTVRDHANGPESTAIPAVRAAESYVVALTSVDHRRIDDQIQSIRILATGGFRATFDEGAADFEKAVRTSRIRSTGKVVSLGVVSSTETGATVLVAARASVRSKGQAEAVERRYRFEVEVARVGGTWLVAAVAEL